MDSISQAALGAAVGGAVLGTRLGRGALLGGALLGTLPDMDVLIDYGDAITNYTEHRGFSHSVLVLVPLAFLLAWVFQRWRPAVSYTRWCVFTTLILVTHPLLDAFTTYGTQLLWPFGGPVGLSSMFIIDPFYTVPLLIACGIAAWRPQRMQALAVGLAVSTAYLGWSLAGQYLITQRVMPTLAANGVADAPRLVQPMPLSTLLWRVTVMGEPDRLEMLVGFFDADSPLQVERFPRDPELERAARNIPRGAQLADFASGFVSYEVVNDTLAATDVRLGIPGVHPFTFGLAENDDGGWRPVPSYRMARPELDPQVWRLLLWRTLGETGQTLGRAEAP